LRGRAILSSKERKGKGFHKFLGKKGKLEWGRPFYAKKISKQKRKKMRERNQYFFTWEERGVRGGFAAAEKEKK